MSKAETLECSLYVDRIEGDVAVLTLRGQTIQLPRSLLPAGAREGSHLRMALSLDEAGERDAEARIAGKQKRGRQEDDGGDFSL